MECEVWACCPLRGVRLEPFNVRLFINGLSIEVHNAKPIVSEREIINGTERNQLDEFRESWERSIELRKGSRGESELSKVRKVGMWS